LARSCPLACESAPLTGTAHLNGFRTRQQVRVALGCGASQGDGATPRWPLRSGGAPPAHRLRVRQGPGARRRPHGPARLPTPRYGGGLWPTARLTLCHLEPRGPCPGASAARSCIAARSRPHRGVRWLPQILGIDGGSRTERTQLHYAPGTIRSALVSGGVQQHLRLAIVLCHNAFRGCTLHVRS